MSAVRNLRCSADVGEIADATDLKSIALNSPCRLESGHRQLISSEKARQRMNIFRKKRRLRPAQVGDGPEQPSAEELATFAREEELYALGNAAARDSFGLSSALMIFRYRAIPKHLASIGKRYSMLHPDVLILLYYLARKSKGDI